MEVIGLETFRRGKRRVCFRDGEELEVIDSESRESKTAKIEITENGVKITLDDGRVLDFPDWKPLQDEFGRVRVACVDDGKQMRSGDGNGTNNYVAHFVVTDVGLVIRIPGRGQFAFPSLTPTPDLKPGVPFATLTQSVQLNPCATCGLAQLCG